MTVINKCIFNYIALDDDTSMIERQDLISLGWYYAKLLITILNYKLFVDFNIVELLEKCVFQVLPVYIPRSYYDQILKDFDTMPNVWNLYYEKHETGKHISISSFV